MRLPIFAFALTATLYAADYRDLIIADAPAAYWRFDDASDCCAQDAAGDKALAADRGQNVSLIADGPRPPGFPSFEAHNVAADFTQAARAFLRVKDPGAKSVFDFAKGETITAEAWVQCRGPLKEWQFVYIVGKGRTAGGNNQNWGLRLLGDGKLARASFIFSGATTGRFHRWNSNLGFAPGDDWHHVAVTYEFGKPESIRTWLDGRASAGVWDDGGATNDAPVVDDDEVWIGSSMGGQASSTFPGAIDEVAIYRRALDEARIVERAKRTAAPAPVPVIALAELPPGKVRVEILEFPTAPGEDSTEFWTADDAKKSTAADPSWAALPPNKTEQWIEPAWLLAALPTKYNERAVKTERSRPFLVRMAGAVTLPPGEHRILLRALTGTRLALDGAVITQTPLKKLNKQDNDPVPDQLEQQLVKTMPLLPPGHVEREATITSDGKPHVLVVESWVGGKSIRPEIGELFVSAKMEDGWRLLGSAVKLSTESAEGHGKAAELSPNLAPLADSKNGVSAKDAKNAKSPAPSLDAKPGEAEKKLVESFSEYRSAEEKEWDGDPEGALEHFRDMGRRLADIQKKFPDYESGMVTFRLRRIADTIEVLERKGVIVNYPGVVRSQRTRIAKLDAKNRRIPAEDAYWKMRHDLAREHALGVSLGVPPLGGNNGGKGDRSSKSRLVPPKGGTPSVDALLAAKHVSKTPLAGSAAFLRRVTLDTIGRIPTAEEANNFLANTSTNKRALAIERLLADPRWADHWTSYWQDVLAENPNILKGTLNNTGPFRWWIHESLLDNKPMDRFATELIAMEGSANYGGPAGFGIATQNDLPMAAKAQVLAGAFLANEMKCARCHDAVHHSFEQRELFTLAAMLGRAPLKVPETSLTKGLSKNSHVTVTLKAGEIIEPHMPFGAVKEPLPGVLRGKGDSREMLAALLTDPRNERFAQVIVNRIWKQFMGFGIVEPVDDWETSQPSHPELLRWLAREFVTNGYDVKHVARLILSSAAYQRAVTPDASRDVRSSERTFSSQARRRLTAEQLLDSLMLAAGQEYETEMITFDPEARQNAKDQGNFGVPRRAWEFASLSNERDRPALAKPRAQMFADVLGAFGWRESRPEPRSTRDHEANIIQPALLANGTFGALITRAHDDSALTALALRDQPAAELAYQLYLALLSRKPTPEESKRLTALLAPGYDTRLTGAARAPKPPPDTKAVSWASHLNPDATTAVLAAERAVKAGPPPTPRLTSDWRDRFEDALWLLLVSPEFAWVP